MAERDLGREVAFELVPHLPGAKSKPEDWLEHHLQEVFGKARFNEVNDSDEFFNERFMGIVSGVLRVLPGLPADWYRYERRDELRQLTPAVSETEVDVGR